MWQRLPPFRLSLSLYRSSLFVEVDRFLGLGSFFKFQLRCQKISDRSLIPVGCSALFAVSFFGRRFIARHFCAVAASHAVPKRPQTGFHIFSLHHHY